jgi:hypothetical protein
MSVFIHTEMSAEDELKNPKPFVCLVKNVGDYVMQRGNAPKPSMEIEPPKKPH